MRTAIRSDAPSASESGTRIVVDDRDAGHRLRPVDERVEHERDERDRGRHHHRPRDPLQPGAFVRAPGAPAPHEVADGTDRGADAGDDHDRRRARRRACDRPAPRPARRTRRSPSAVATRRGVGAERDRRGGRARGAGRSPGGSRWRRRAPRPPSRGGRPKRRCGRAAPVPKRATAPTSAPTRHQRGERLARPVPRDEDRGRDAPRQPRARAATHPLRRRVVGQRRREHDEHRRRRS